jgi:sulfur-carrier protein
VTARLLLPAALRRYAGEDAEVEIRGGTLGAALDELAERLPQLERRLRDEQGLLRPHVLLFVDGVSVRGGVPMETPVRDGAEVFVAPAVSGGSGDSVRRALREPWPPATRASGAPTCPGRSAIR